MKQEDVDPSEAEEKASKLKVRQTGGATIFPSEAEQKAHKLERQRERDEERRREALGRQKGADRMSIEHVLAVVPVVDIERADAWYQALFGRPADNWPMPTLVEWQVTSAGWVQVTVDAERAGAAQLNLAVDDLATTKDELAGRGLRTGETQSANEGVELCTLDDPDGNVVTLIGNFRVALLAQKQQR